MRCADKNHGLKNMLAISFVPFDWTPPQSLPSKLCETFLSPPTPSPKKCVKQDQGNQSRSPILTYLDRFGPLWTCLDPFEPILTHLDPFGAIWS